MKIFIKYKRNNLINSICLEIFDILHKFNTKKIIIKIVNPFYNFIALIKVENY